MQITNLTPSHQVFSNPNKGNMTDHPKKPQGKSINITELPENYYNRALVKKSNLSFTGSNNSDVVKFYTKHKDFIKEIAQKNIPENLSVEQELILTSLGLGNSDIQVIGTISQKDVREKMAQMLDVLPERSQLNVKIRQIGTPNSILLAKNSDGSLYLANLQGKTQINGKEIPECQAVNFANKDNVSGFQVNLGSLQLNLRDLSKDLQKEDLSSILGADTVSKLKEVIRTVKIEKPNRAQNDGFIFQRNSQGIAPVINADAKYVVKTPPSVTFSDIGGLEEEIKQIRTAAMLKLKHPELHKFRKPSKGVLLSGPPGCGKTMIAKALANEMYGKGINFINISAPELINKYLGQSEENLREIFKEAEAHEPCVIFIDEIDAIASQRKGDSTTVHYDKVVNQFLTLLDGFDSDSKIFVIGATNRADMIDEAVKRPGRLYPPIEIGNPGYEGIVKIIEITNKNKNVSEDFNSREFAKKLVGLSGAEVSFVSSLATDFAMERAGVSEAILDNAPINIEKIVLTAKDFENALSIVKGQKKQTDKDLSDEEYKKKNIL